MNDDAVSNCLATQFLQCHLKVPRFRDYPITPPPISLSFTILHTVCHLSLYPSAPILPFLHLTICSRLHYAGTRLCARDFARLDTFQPEEETPFRAQNLLNASHSVRLNVLIVAKCQYSIQYNEYSAIRRFFWDASVLDPPTLLRATEAAVKTNELHLTHGSERSKVRVSTLL